MDEPVDPPSEAAENPSSRDDGELTRLENDLAAIEEAPAEWYTGARLRIFG